MASGAAVSPAGQVASYEAALLRISKADKRTIALFAEGIYLAQYTARDIDDLRQQACADRMRLARSFLLTAEKLLRQRPPQFRSSISRFYYAMYHATRAVVYFSHGGDDHEAHKNLPTQIPGDFPNASIWQNALKDARSRRNEADYDPYPTDSRTLRQVASDLASQAPILIALAESYLATKGCAHI